jgi:hypothetical protein
LKKPGGGEAYAQRIGGIGIYARGAGKDFLLHHLSPAAGKRGSPATGFIVVGAPTLTRDFGPMMRRVGGRFYCAFGRLRHLSIPGAASFW